MVLAGLDLLIVILIILQIPMLVMTEQGPEPGVMYQSIIISVATMIILVLLKYMDTGIDSFKNTSGYCPENRIV